MDTIDHQDHFLIEIFIASKNNRLEKKKRFGNWFDDFNYNIFEKQIFKSQTSVYNLN